MSRLTRDGTAEPASRDQILRHARGQGNIIFHIQLTTSRIGNLTRLIHTLLYVMTIHTYTHRHSRRRLGSPWVCPINAALKRLKVAAVTPDATSTLSASRVFRFSLPLPVFGRLFLFLHPRGHKPSAPFTYCAILGPRVKCVWLPQSCSWSAEQGK